MFHLKVKPSPPSDTGLRDARPRRRLLGDREAARLLGAHRLVELRAGSRSPRGSRGRRSGWQPLARLAAVVEVEHRRDGVDAQAVDVELVEPVERVGDEEVAHLRAAVVEDQRAPVGVLAEPRVVVLVQRGAVEAAQREVVLRESAPAPSRGSRRCPRWWQRVDEEAEVVRRAVARRRREVADDLIAPRARRTGAPPPAAARRA